MNDEIVILDVGHGSSTVVRSGETAVVVDAGPGTALLEYLSASTISRVSAILISHADTDHLKGLVALLDQDKLPIDSVYLNSDAVKGSNQWQAIVYSLEERRRNGSCDFKVELTEGMNIPLGARTTVEVLAPRPALAATGPGSRDRQGRRINTNTMSAVVRVTLKNSSVLLTGDLDEIGLEHLLDSGQNLNCQTLVFPHHGGNVATGANESRNSAFTNRLLGAVEPETVVFSLGRLKFQNPRPEIVQTVIESGDRTVMCTQMSTHCRPTGDFGGVHLADIFAAGRQQGRCCAGSVVLSDSGTTPSVGLHAQFISESVPTPLCRKPGRD